MGVNRWFQTRLPGTGTGSGFQNWNWSLNFFLFPELNQNWTPGFHFFEKPQGVWLELLLVCRVCSGMTIFPSNNYLCHNSLWLDKSNSKMTTYVQSNIPRFLMVPQIVFLFLASSFQVSKFLYTYILALFQNILTLSGGESC